MIIIKSLDDVTKNINQSSINKFERNGVTFHSMKLNLLSIVLYRFTLFKNKNNPS